MSRGYQVEWVSVKSSVQHGDRLELDVGLLCILPEDQMRALLREELARDGWTRETDGSMKKEIDGTPVTLSPDATTIAAQKSAEAAVKAVGTSATSAKQELARSEENAKAQLGAQLTRELTKIEGAVRPMVDAAVQRVYVEALKRKASALGQLESVVESRGEGGALEVTIKVRT